MTKFLFFVWKQIYLRRRVLFAFLALLPLLLLLAYNIRYNKIENTNRRHLRESLIRHITKSNPPARQTTSGSITIEMKAPDVASTKITITNVYNSTKDKVKDIKIHSKANENVPFNISAKTKVSLDIATTKQRLKAFTYMMNKQQTETKTTPKLTTPHNAKTDTQANTKPNFLTANQVETEADTKKKKSHKSSTKTESKVTTITPTKLKQTITVPQVPTVNLAKNGRNSTSAKIQATVTNKQKTGYSNDNINKIPHKNKMTSFSFSNPLRNIVSENFFEPYCAMYSNSFKYLIWPDSPSNLNDWSYKSKRKCPKFTENINNTKRMKYNLHCGKNHPKLIPSFTNRSDDIQLVTLDDPCLHAFTNSCCNDTRGIPNIVHYVWYFKNEMSFSMFTSMVSVIRFVRPCLILFHGEYLPYGKYWDYIVRIYPNILHILTIRPLYIFGKKIIYHEHSGDIMRMEALMQLGGMYFDTDVIVLRDLEPLRDYDMTLCYQATGYLLNAFIMAKKNATFLNLWMDGYRKDYKNDSYAYNSMFYNKDLSKNRTDLIHIEDGTICSPLVLVGVPVNSTMVYDWSKLFGYHLYSRSIHFPLSEGWVKHFNSTIGAMVRHVIYGNKELCEGPVHTFS